MCFPTMVGPLRNMNTPRKAFGPFHDFSLTDWPARPRILRRTMHYLLRHVEIPLIIFALLLLRIRHLLLSNSMSTLSFL